MAAIKMKGTIKRVVQDKGFGFLGDDDSGLEYFFHRSMLTGRIRFEQLAAGDAVHFTAGESNPKGPRAESVETV